MLTNIVILKYGIFALRFGGINKLRALFINLPDSSVVTTRRSMYDQTCVMQLKPYTELPEPSNHPPFKNSKMPLLIIG